MRPRIDIVVVAFSLALALLLAAARCTSEEDPNRSPSLDKAEAVETLASAAAWLGAEPAARYRGFYTDTDGERVDVDLKVTDSGEATGWLVSRDRRGQFLSVDNRSFIKAGRDFWSAQGVVDGNQLASFSGRWVLMRAEDLGIDLSDLLALGAVEERLRGFLADTAQESLPATGATLAGTPVVKLTASGWTFYATSSSPHRIVRIESSSSSPSEESSASGEMRLASAESRGLRLDIGSLPRSQVADTFRALSQRVEQLRNSADSQVGFTVSASGNLTGCNAGLCIVTLQVSNSLTAGGAVEPKSVDAALMVRVTVDGRFAGTCTDSKLLAPNGTTTMSCTVPTPPWASNRKGPHVANAIGEVRARAVSAPDVRRMLDSIEHQRAAALCKATGNSFILGTRVLTSNGALIPVQDLRIGDEVVASKRDRKSTTTRPITAVIRGHGAKTLVTIRFQRLDGIGTVSVTATEGHRFWLVNRDRWVKARDVRIGDRLATATGSATRVLDVNDHARSARVRNLAVRGRRTYYVGNQGTSVLVHNQNIPPCPPVHSFSAGQLEHPDFATDIARGGRPDDRKKAAPYLARNMVAMGLSRKPRGTAAHHIVAWGAGKSPNAPGYMKAAVAARRILERYGVDVNSAANGVYLRVPDHTQLHRSTNYYAAVTERLREARTKEDVIDILNSIREQLLKNPTSLK